MPSCTCAHRGSSPWCRERSCWYSCSDTVPAAASASPARPPQPLVLPSSVPGRPPPPPPSGAPPTPPARPASRGSGGLESTTRPGSHASLKLFSLGLQYCGSKECHLLALLYTA